MNPLPILYIITLALSASWAEAPAKIITKAELAQELKLYQSLTTLKVDFKQKKTLKSIGVELLSSGKFSLNRPTKKVIWEVVRPSPLTVSITEKEVLIETTSNGKRETQLFKLGDAPSEPGTKSLTSLIGWLNLDAKTLSEEYDITQIAPSQYRFIPKVTAHSPFQKLEMTLDAKKQLKKLSLMERSEDSIEIEFGKPIIK